ASSSFATAPSLSPRSRWSVASSYSWFGVGIAASPVEVEVKGVPIILDTHPPSRQAPRRHPHLRSGMGLASALGRIPVRRETRAEFSGASSQGKAGRLATGFGRRCGGADSDDGIRGTGGWPATGVIPEFRGGIDAIRALAYSGREGLSRLDPAVSGRGDR